MSLRHLLLGLALLAGCMESPMTAPERTVSDFTFPWSEKPTPRTTFQCRVNDNRLMFQFDVADDDLIVSEDWNGESTLDAEDRVELFFAADPELERYYCIEIDSLGRVHDYAAEHYRVFDSTWNCPGLQTEAERTADGYQVRGTLPLETLTALVGERVRSGSVIRLGLFRAEFHGATRGEANDNWISWIRPSTDAPDFHVPSAFAEFTLP